MSKDENINVICINISKELNKHGFELVNADYYQNLNEYKIYLIKKIEQLMANNYEKLINALYVIDINEEKLKALFSSDNKEYIPPILADLIIERQLQKLSFRKMYREGKF